MSRPSQSSLDVDSIRTNQYNYNSKNNNNSSKTNNNTNSTTVMSGYNRNQPIKAIPLSATKINKVPIEDLRRLDDLNHQYEALDRLRSKSLDKRIERALSQGQKNVNGVQVPTQKNNQLKIKRGVRPSSSHSMRSGLTDSQQASLSLKRHQQQQKRLETSTLSQNELNNIQNQYQYQLNTTRPSSARPYTEQSRPSTSQSPQQFQWGRAHEPADKSGELLSKSTQSKLTGEQIKNQKPAGKASDNMGNDLASILGGGHESIIFGNQNAKSAQTRNRINHSTQDEADAANAFNESINSRVFTQQSRAPAYAPFATTIDSPQTLAAPSRFNDASGAVLIREELSGEARHAPAAIGYGKAHPGFREYIARPAAATGLAKGPKEQGLTIDPFAGDGGNLLMWSGDGRERNTKQEEMNRLKQILYSKTSGDYGTGPLQGQTNAARKPVAGVIKPKEGPLSLAHDNGNNDVMGVTGTSYSPVPIATLSSSSSQVAPSSSSSSRSRPTSAIRPSNNGNPLNPYSIEELANFVSTKQLNGAASIGYGKRHPLFKKHVLRAGEESIEDVDSIATGKK